MLTEIEIAPHRLIGVSVGGVYTSLHVPTLDAIFDVGISPRSSVGAGHLFLSHGHADHVGALVSLLGIRGLSHQPAPRTFAPREIARDLAEGVTAFSRSQRRPLDLTIESVAPGDEIQLENDLWVRVFRTLHTVPSVGYLLLRKVDKILDEYRRLPPREIAALRKSGEKIFRTEERLELAYATDTLIDVLDATPELYSSRVLILECTFLDDQKGRDETRRKCHVHLDEVIERADKFQNEHLVLMHFSQLYSPAAVHEIMKQRLPAALAARTRVFAPKRGSWPG